jgi:uncharacterized protein with PIN domain
MSRPLEFMVRELATISKDVSKGLMDIVIPPPKPAIKKLKWYQCQNCKRGYWIAE